MARMAIDRKAPRSNRIKRKRIYTYFVRALSNMSEMHVYRFGPGMTDGKADRKIY
jgi:hypothetical protein